MKQKKTAPNAKGGSAQLTARLRGWHAYLPTNQVCRVGRPHQAVRTEHSHIWIIKITPVVRILSTSINHGISWIPHAFFAKTKHAEQSDANVPSFWHFDSSSDFINWDILFFFSLMSFVKMTYPWKIHANKTRAGFLTCRAETPSSLLTIMQVYCH